MNQKREILGKSPVVLEMLKMIGRVSPSKTNVLIIGESGTGKELVARMIHDSGPIASKPFVPINCGAIPESLIESEMFGHRRGSFTGAIAEKAGLFETANGGTLFLDEVGELPLSMQVKLLRAIQERVFRKVGGTEDVRVDVRIIAATNRDLEAGVAKGTFREDLYYRLNVLLIKTPPLRDRIGDVKTLAEEFVKKFSIKQKKNVLSIDARTLKALEAHSWPGNVRELENVIERAVTLEVRDRVTVESLPTPLQELVGLIPPEGGVGGAADKGGASSVLTPDFSRGRVNLKKIVSKLEKIYVESALEKADGDKKKAASLLGLTPRDFSRKMSELKIK